jgi:hypothetical protein
VILGAVYSDSESVDLADVSARNERRERLKQFTADTEILDNVDSVAFTQEKLEQLVESGANTIYLCGERFDIPDKVGITYVGVNKAVEDIVCLDGIIQILEDLEDFEEQKNSFSLLKLAAELGHAMPTAARETVRAS